MYSLSIRAASGHFLEGLVDLSEGEYSIHGGLYLTGGKQAGGFLQALSVLVDEDEVVALTATGGHASHLGSSCSR